VPTGFDFREVQPDFREAKPSPRSSAGAGGAGHKCHHLLVSNSQKLFDRERPRTRINGVDAHARRQPQHPRPPLDESLRVPLVRLVEGALVRGSNGIDAAEETSAGVNSARPVW
jgi:hypothetical protein